MRRRAHSVWLRDQRRMLLALGTLAIWSAAWPLVRTRRDRLSVAQRYDRYGLLLAAALAVPLATWVAHAPLREFPHYYLQAYPWNALLVGLFIEELWLLVPLRRLDTLFAMALLLPNLWWTADNLERVQIPRYDVRDRSQWDECRFVRAHSTESDRLFIWGYRADLYTICRRRPASRFVYTTMVAGYVEWFDRSQEQEERSAAPGSRDALIADLEASRPPVLIDAGVFFGRKLARYPQLMTYVDAHYCLSGQNNGVDHYVRRNNDGGCPAN